ncbi:hypothetical protein OPQ81_002191 [Rhizoctonia solani]|nr:hypothetical protein OPQ81_002191 [Rhizoctonia solani]
MSPSRVATSRRENIVNMEHNLYVSAQLWLIKNLGKDLVGYWNIDISFPILQAISHNALPVQASFVSSERAFSSSKNTYTLPHNKLGTDTLKCFKF